MREFAYLSLYTKYQMRYNNMTVVPMDRYPCFRSAYNKLASISENFITADYDIVIHRGYVWGQLNAVKNACLLSRKELREHLNQLKGIVPFTYGIKKYMDGDDEALLVSVHVHEGTVLQHKYLLNWIRHTYEFPHNVVLRESRALRKVKGFQFMSGFNLFNLVGQCANLWSDEQSVAFKNTVKLIDKNTLKQRLENSDKSIRVNNIFDCYNTNAKTLSWRRSIGKFDIEYWDDENLFNEVRLPLYKERLRNLKTV